MKTFEFIRPPNSAAAITTAAQAKTAQQGAEVRYIAGGTTLLDLMKLNVETPGRLLDINRLPLDKIETTADGGLKIGATVRNSDLAHHATVRRDYSALSQAILAGASTQLRNMATTAGNLLQRTRCMYFRDTAMPCNKREPGTGCPAISGSNRTLAVLGISEHCIATNPSDMCVALAALEATVHVQGAKGPRAVPIGDFHLLPGNTPHRETVLEPGDLITHVTLPAPITGSKQVYLKLRDRASYEFALASAAVVINMDGQNVTRARIALGGVGAKPWRSREAEAALVGQPADGANFRKAAEAALLYAVPVEATIANGKVTKLDTAAAEKMPGVRAIFHRENIGKISRSTQGQGFEGITDERRPPFEDDVVRYYGQYVALAVADTFETAKAAADAVRVTYAKEKPNVETELKADDEPDVVATTLAPAARLQSKRGEPEGAFARAPVKLDQTYVTPTETHNPLELHATTAVWEDSKLTLYETTQSIFNTRNVLAQMFGLPQENVRVLSKFLGSGFGSKLWPWTHCPLRSEEHTSELQSHHDL